MSLTVVLFFCAIILFCRFYSEAHIRNPGKRVYAFNFSGFTVGLPDMNFINSFLGKIVFVFIKKPAFFYVGEPVSKKRAIRIGHLILQGGHFYLMVGLFQRHDQKQIVERILIIVPNIYIHIERFFRIEFWQFKSLNTVFMPGTSNRFVFVKNSFLIAGNN